MVLSAQTGLSASTRDLYLPHEVVTEQGTIILANNGFYYWDAPEKERDVLLRADSQLSEILGPNRGEVEFTVLHSHGANKSLSRRLDLAGVPFLEVFPIATNQLLLTPKAEQGDLRLISRGWDSCHTELLVSPDLYHWDTRIEDLSPVEATLSGTGFGLGLSLKRWLAGEGLYVEVVLQNSLLLRSLRIDDFGEQMIGRFQVEGGLLRVIANCGNDDLQPERTSCQDDG